MKKTQMGNQRWPVSPGGLLPGNSIADRMYELHVVAANAWMLHDGSCFVVMSCPDNSSSESRTASESRLQCLSSLCKVMHGVKVL